MAACSKVSEGGGERGGDAHHCERSHGRASRRSACAASQTDDCFFFFSSSIVGYNRRSAKTLRQVDGAEASRGVKPL